MLKFSLVYNASSAFKDFVPQIPYRTFAPGPFHRRRSGHVPPNSGKIFGNYRVKFGYLSGKYHAKFGHFANFSHIFGQKWLAPKVD